MVNPASQCRLNGSLFNREISNSIKFSTVKILGCWNSRLFEFSTACRMLEFTTVWILDCFVLDCFNSRLFYDWLKWYESVLKVYLCCYGLCSAGDLTVVNFWEMQTFITLSLRVDWTKPWQRKLLHDKFVWPGVLQGRLRLSFSNIAWLCTNFQSGHRGCINTDGC